MVCSFFYAGLFMMLAFNWCLVKGETFSATVFGSFSGFYLSFGAILTPVSQTSLIFLADNGLTE